MSLCAIVAIMVAMPQPDAATGGKDDAAQIATFSNWVQEMKRSERGPFRRLRWFCADGSIHPPRPYACSERGGGVQHGEYSQRTEAIRDAGYLIANVLADLDVESLLNHPQQRQRIAQILVEKFLIAIDDGFVLRQARFYRGALQEEDERAGARKLLLRLLDDDVRVDRELALIRAAARLLPHGANTRSAKSVRQLSSDLSERDPGFLTLRNKIHVQPQAADARAVRDYAATSAEPQLKKDLLRLAQEIENLFQAREAAPALKRLADQAAKHHRDLAGQLNDSAKGLSDAQSARQRYLQLAKTLAELRDSLRRVNDTGLRLQLVDASLLLESELFVTATELEDELATATRREWIELLNAALDASYGAALLSTRQRTELASAITYLAASSVDLSSYKRTIDQLNLVPGWAAQRLRFHFDEAMHTLGELEPKSHRFIEDQLRGSPLFHFGQLLEVLARDSNRLAGVQHRLFDETLGSGLRALNPGLAKGKLLRAPANGQPFESNGIYILPETESDLPPVAGILTAGEGNPLSHVQLLARNLGIPNVGVDNALLARIEAFVGHDVLLAVSSAGSVELAALRPEHQSLFALERDASRQTLIEPDLAKLDLSVRTPLTLSDLRATDSGRTVGPKAAKLGELKHSYPQAVEEGIAIPFGVFRALLDQPHDAGQGSVFDWMVASYRRLESMPKGSVERQQATESFRLKLYQWVANVQPNDAFRHQLTDAMQRVFGPDGSYGVFVRSDTNVEDLPNFTGAGLNLTVPHVVGVRQVLAAIPRVWASPFTARAFAWRQNHMPQPEHVYPAVLLLKSVNADKSGVMVTQDIDTGASDWLSVAVNEGVGGAVDGQAAESLRIATTGSQVRLMAQATAPSARRLAPKGGVIKVPASGNDYVLERAEIDQLVALHHSLPDRFPAIVNAQGHAAAADIEFGFLDGQLKLFQIRPFLESQAARSNAFLQGLDANLKDIGALSVNMNEVAQ